MIIKEDKNKARKQRAKRQSDIVGTAKKPRLTVHRSLIHVYAQLIDDEKGVTLVAVNSLQDAIEKKAKGKPKKEVVFDRSGYVYHGRVSQVAEGARKGGLQF